MKLTVFGHWGGYPIANEGTSSYLIEENGFKLLMDVGASAVSIMQNYIDPETIDAAIISHYHPDHIADVGILQHIRLLSDQQVNPEVMPIYGHKEDDKYKLLQMDGVTEFRPYSGEESIEIGPFRISFLKTIHPVPCYAFRIKAGGQTLVYTADSAYQDSFIPFADHADLLITDTNFFKDMAGKSKVHMASTEVGELAAKAQVKHLLLSHLPQRGELTLLKAEAASKYDGKITVAAKGLTIEI